MDKYTGLDLQNQPAVTTYSSGIKNADGETVERQEGKPYKRKITIIESVNEQGEVDERKVHQHDENLKKPHRNWGRYWMGYQEALLKMVEHAKMDFKVFNFLLGSADRFNVANNIIIADMVESLGVTRQTISKSLRFLKDEEIIEKVKGVWMVNPFIVAKPNASQEDIVSAQLLWEKYVGFYGSKEEHSDVLRIIADIKKKNKRKPKSVVSQESKEISDSLKSTKKLKQQG